MGDIEAMEFGTRQESSTGRRPSGDRGQTNQDYIIGITFLLISVLFVFGYVPGLYSSYADPVDGTQFTQTDRAAEWLVDNYSVEGAENVLEYDATDPSVGIMGLSDETEFDAFRRNASINTTTNRRARPNVNVMIVNSSQLNAQQLSDPIVADGNRLEFGDDYENQSAATSKRVVDLNMTDEPAENRGDVADSDDYCTPSCWLIVRIW
ncbi:DUF7287 family protein [Halorientalis pallida]|uniref:Uncharacterized protein n=1 Tax=Halorientalis pallida TaxID=2479928 RepID=A0A498KW52_9EURY|nr:hypothetical protein [Halorientalis pallida]RXK49469.1 hypothetical protein EAF64_11210 [Halorientalis pallida]